MQRKPARLLTSIVAVTAVVASLLVATTLPAGAAVAPVVPVPATTGMSADALPTVQVNGVVWSQAVIGNTVYAGGSFSTARPAGAAPGTSTTARSNLLAYNITTGQLITSFAPSINAQVLSVAAAPDGSRVYIGGDFSSVNGTSRNKLAALNPSTGALDTSFAASGVGGQVRAVTAAGSSVYVGGSFRALGNGTSRNYLAAFRASDGGTLPWNPSADYTVWTLSATTDARWVFAGGSFQNVGGQPAYGLAKIDGTSGALDTSWRPAVRNGGPDAGIYTLRVQGGSVYGTAWTFGPGGNLEGPFKLSVASPAVEWVTACHGDSYGIFMTGGVVYTSGHTHYCGSIGGGFPQYPTWRFQHAMAWTDAAGGEIMNDLLNYPNWHGLANAPSMVGWLPTMAMGSYTGQYQAGWDVAGNSDYVLYGGEFPTVNGVGQQGLVRFARRGLAPNKQGPTFPTGGALPRLVPTSSTSLRVSWTTGYDRDDYNLTYKVVRDGVTGSPRFTTSVGSSWWSLPTAGFVDTGLTPGATYRYQLVTNDSTGNTVFGPSATITMPTSMSAGNGYAQSVRANGARIYWPMNEASGLITDRAAGNGSSSHIGVTDGTAGSGVARNQAGAITGDTAVTLGDNDASRIYANGSEQGTDTFTISAWVRTSTTRGGRILGFGDLQESSSVRRDRHLYMDNAGHVLFGVRAQNGSARTVASAGTYRDNQWHMLAATMSSAGMRLYVDGALVGSRTDTTAADAYLGYWRVGGDTLDGWPSQPSSRNFAGGVDEVAIYPTALSQATIQSQYGLRNGGGGGGGGNQAPTASFTSSTAGLTASFDGRGSSDPDGSIASYAWNFGDGSTATGATPSRTYAAAGTYTVRLTVTDNAGATGSSTQQVTVSAATPGVVASDNFERSVTGGWGSAQTGGAWALTTAASNFSVSGGSARAQMAAGTGPNAYLSSTSVRDVDLRTAFSPDKAGTGGGIYSSLVGRRSGTSDYRAKVRVTATETTLYLCRTVNGAETTLTTAVVPGLVVAAGGSVSVRLQLTGASPTTVRAKVWRTGTTEPSAWTSTTTDSAAGVQGAGAVGMYLYLSGSATNGPVTIGIPDFTATAP